MTSRDRDFSTRSEAGLETEEPHHIHVEECFLVKNGPQMKRVKGEKRPDVVN